MLVTSIPPPHLFDGRLESLLPETLRSFDKNGFSTISVNWPAEIDLLEPSFPGIAFVAADRSRAIFPERYGPSIGSVLGACAGHDACAIVNADIYMLESDIVDVVNRNPGTFFVAHRLDVDRIRGDIVGVYRRGTDAVFFNPERFAALAEDPDLGRFQLGAPFWDIVIPIVASFHGVVSFIDPPFILHPVHRARWSHADYDTLREAAIKTVIGHAQLHADRSDQARLFLQLIDRHVGRKRDVLNRRSIRNAKMIFNLWIAKVERANAQAIRVKIDGELNHPSLQGLSGELVETPTDSLGAVDGSSASMLSLWRLNRLAKSSLRNWKQRRREKAVTDRLAGIEF